MYFDDGIQQNVSKALKLIEPRSMICHVQGCAGLGDCSYQAWVTERVRDWHAEVGGVQRLQCGIYAESHMPAGLWSQVSELSSGDVVIAHFKRPGNQHRHPATNLYSPKGRSEVGESPMLLPSCRSVQTDRGIVLTILQRGEVARQVLRAVLLRMGLVLRVTSRQVSVMFQDDITQALRFSSPGLFICFAANLTSFPRSFPKDGSRHAMTYS